jgi:hypothetical protein
MSVRILTADLHTIFQGDDGGRAPVYFNETTWCYVTEVFRLHTYFKFLVSRTYVPKCDHNVIVRIQISAAESMKVEAFCVTAPCSLEVHRCFWGFYCFYHQGDSPWLHGSTT